MALVLPQIVAQSYGEITKEAPHNHGEQDYELKLEKVSQVTIVHVCGLMSAYILSIGMK